MNAFKRVAVHSTNEGLLRGSNSVLMMSHLQQGRQQKTLESTGLTPPPDMLEIFDREGHILNKTKQNKTNKQKTKKKNSRSK